MKIVENESCQVQHFLEKSTLSKITSFRTIIPHPCPSLVKRIQNQSFQDHNIPQNENYPKSVLIKTIKPSKSDIYPKYVLSSLPYPTKLKHPKSVLSKPQHPSKLKMIKKSVILGPPCPSKLEIFKNLFLLDQNIYSESSVSQRTWTMNVLGKVFAYVTKKWPFQDHLQSNIIIWTQWVPSPGPWSLNELGRIFPTVTDKKPFQDHLLSKSIISTQWSLSPRRPEEMCRVLHMYICYSMLMYWCYANIM